jgi:large subunit ribosomal protein L18
MQFQITKRNRRHKKIRAKVIGTSACPRLCVFKSNKFIYTQIIDDEKSKTLVACSTKEIKAGKTMEAAQKLGKELVEKAKKAKITSIVFDRGGYLYTGKVKALADSVREAGLKF